MPEVIDAGVTGCIVNDMREADQAVRWAMSLDRRRVRDRFERRFTARRMAEDYVSLYEDLLQVKHVAPSIVPLQAEKGEAVAFRLMQAQAMAVGRRRIELSMHIAELEGPARRS